MADGMIFLSQYNIKMSEIPTFTEESLTPTETPLSGGAKKRGPRKGRKQHGGEEPVVAPPIVELEQAPPVETPIPGVAESVVVEPQSLIEQQGGKRHKKHNGRSYVVRTGSRGGHYILVKGKKLYV